MGLPPRSSGSIWALPSARLLSQGEGGAFPVGWGEGQETRQQDGHAVHGLSSLRDPQ